MAALRHVPADRKCDSGSEGTAGVGCTELTDTAFTRTQHCVKAG